MRRPALFAPTLLAAGALLAACTAAASPSPTTTPAPEATDLCLAAENGSAELEAGRYRAASTQPAVTLTLPAGFTAACADGTFSLFGPDGGVSVIAPVASVQHGEEQVPVDATVAAVQAALAEAAVATTTAQPATVGGVPGVEFVVTVDEAGLGLRSAQGRGWAFNSEESERGGISLFEVDGVVVGMIRHGDDPLATVDDLLTSFAFE